MKSGLNTFSTEATGKKTIETKSKLRRLPSYLFFRHSWSNQSALDPLGLHVRSPTLDPLQIKGHSIPCGAAADSLDAHQGPLDSPQPSVPSCTRNSGFNQYTSSTEIQNCHHTSILDFNITGCCQMNKTKVVAFDQETG